MFQKSKTCYKIVALCENEDENKKSTYTFTLDYDDVLDEVLNQKFFDEFGIYPTHIQIISREAI